MILNNTKGNTLLIVLIATFVLLSSVLYLNKIVLNQVKIQNDDTKLKSSIYAAESGVERALYLIRKNGISLPTVIANNSYNTANLSNGSSYKIISDNTYVPTLHLDSIAANTTYSLDVTSYLSTIRSFTVNWDSPGNELFYISIARYRTNGNFQSYNFRNSYNHNTSSPVTINININPQNNRIYRLLLNPLYYSATDVNVTFYSGPNATGNPVNVVPGQLQRIRSVGNIGDNNKSVTSDFLINSQY